MLRFYELAYLVSPKLEENELENLNQEIKNFIKETEGTIEGEFPISKIKLGYPIDKEVEAYFVSFDLYYLPEKILDLKKKLESKKEILRHIIFKKLAKPTVKTAKLTEAPKIEKKAPKPKKVELKELDKKLEEILKE
jgi:ribosomal protein S6